MARIIDVPTDAWARRKQETMDVLGGIMTKMPVLFWETNMLFSGVKNVWWRQKTSGFPATSFATGTHPLFVLRKNGNHSFSICPCSSRGGNSLSQKRMRDDADR